MLNKVILVGRIEKKEKNQITIAVPRSYKNESGDYETDLFDIKLFGSIAETTNAYCHVGDMVGVKGRLESQENTPIIITEQMSFLTSRNNEK